MNPNLLAALAPSVLGMLGGQQQPQLLPSDDAIEKGLGDMYSDDMFSEKGPPEGVDGYSPIQFVGDYEDDDWDDWDDDGDDMGGVDAYSAGESVGALFDGSGRRRRQQRRSERRARRGKKNREELTAEVTDQSYALSAVTKKLNSAIMVNRRQSKQIATLHKRTKAAEKRVIKNKYVRAVTSAATVIPGIRAYTQNTSDAAIALRTAAKTLVGLIDGLDTIDDVALPTQSDPADLAGAQTNLEAYVAPVAAKCDEISEVLNTITEALSDAGLVTKITAVEEVFEANQLTNLATYIPSQWEDREAALVEAGVKYIFGRADEDGDNTFSLSF